MIAPATTVSVIRRREGYEFMVGPPKVINKENNGKKLEPFEVNTPLSNLKMGSIFFCLFYILN